MKLKRLNEVLLSEYKPYQFKKIKERTIGLVGSARFKDHFLKIESLLQILHEKMVILCSMDGLLHKDQFSLDEWEALQRACLKKLNMVEAILVLDIEGYIGDHTREEIECAENDLGKPVYYLSQLKSKENKGNP